MSIVVKERPTLIRKKKEVDYLVKLIEENDIVGLVQMENIGNRQLQNIKKKLKGQAIIKMAKNAIMHRAILKSKKKDIGKLSELIEGSTAFIFTQMTGFQLAQFLRQNKTKAFARPGQIAPKDIIIPEGNTNFQPGPMITELNELGLKTKIVKGSVWIAEDTVVTKEGKEIPRKITVLLSKLNIQPMKVGLDLSAVYEKGDIFKREDLDINVDKIKTQLQRAFNEALNLSVNTNYPIKENIKQLISIASSKAQNLVQNIGIVLPETVGNILSKAKTQANSLYESIKEKNKDI